MAGVRATVTKASGIENRDSWRPGNPGSKLTGKIDEYKEHGNSKDGGENQVLPS